MVVKYNKISRMLTRASRRKWFYTDELEMSVFFFIDSNREEDISRTISNIRILSNKNNDIYVIDIAAYDVEIFKTFEGVKYFKVEGGFEPEKISSLISDKNIVVGVSSDISLNKEFLDYIDINFSDNMSFFRGKNIDNSILFISSRDILHVRKYYKHQILMKSFMRAKEQDIPSDMFSIGNSNFKKKTSLDFKVLNKDGEEVDPYNNKIINSMWIGDDLTNVEKLSINSFLKNGHDFHLYVYDDIGGIPDGVIVKDANTILDSSKIFKYKRMKERGRDEIGNEGFAGFADWFRYVLLHKKGGWWSDLDVICLKNFNILRPYFFTTMNGEGEWFTNGIFKVPRNSLVMSFCIKYCEDVGDDAIWMATGPGLLYNGYVHYNLNCFAKTEEVLDLFKSGTGLFKDQHTNIGEAYSVHMYNSELEISGKDKNGIFPENSFFEKMKQKYL